MGEHKRKPEEEGFKTYQEYLDYKTSEFLWRTGDAQLRKMIRVSRLGRGGIPKEWEDAKPL